MQQLNRPGGSYCCHAGWCWGLMWSIDVRTGIHCLRAWCFVLPSLDQSATQRLMLLSLMAIS